MSKYSTTNTLHIGMKTTDFTDFEILESFEKKYPHLSISYSYLEENELIDGLKAHQLDAFNFSKHALLSTKTIQLKQQPYLKKTFLLFVQKN